MASSNSSTSSSLLGFVNTDEFIDEGLDNFEEIDIPAPPKSQFPQELIIEKKQKKRTKRLNETKKSNELYYEKELLKRQRLQKEEEEESNQLFLNPFQENANRDQLWQQENPQEEFSYVRDPFANQLESLLRPGEPIIPEKCFACKMDDPDSPHYVMRTQWSTLFETFKQCLMNVGDLKTIADGLYHIFHKHIVVTVQQNATDTEILEILGPPDQEIWSRYAIMYHYLRHSIDPEIEAWINIKRTQDLIDICYTSQLVKVHKESGRTMVDESGVKILKELLTLQKSNRSWSTSKMLFAKTAKKLPTDYDGLNPFKQSIREQILYDSFGGTHKSFK